MKQLKKGTAFFLSLFWLSVIKAAAITPEDAMKNAWKKPGGVYDQLRGIADGVVFPALSLILLVCFVVRCAMTYKYYKENGELCWKVPALLFIALCVVLAAPKFLWQAI